jgi:hypothetical protein
MLSDLLTPLGQPQTWRTSSRRPAYGTKERAGTHKRHTRESHAPLRGTSAVFDHLWRTAACDWRAAVRRARRAG